MSRPSLASLRLFVDLARTLSFSDTAATAGITQPALSRTIRLLEEGLDEKLFVRTTRTVTLTAAGELLLPVATRLIGDYDDAFDGLTEMFKGTGGVVVLGALPSFAASALPQILDRFHRDYPHVAVTIRDRVAGELYRQLRDRTVDLAFTTPPDDTDLFTFAPLFDDPCVMACAPARRPADRLTVDWAWLAAQPFLAMTADSSVRAMTDGAFAASRLDITPLYECSQLSTMGALLAAGHGVTVLPASALPMLEGFGLASLPLAGLVPRRQVGLAHLSRRYMTPAARALGNAISFWYQNRMIDKLD
ncbi:LysR family transcriptional regulator [Sphingomonas sp. CLY1604]|uniref:LysR family transcriptional regulator n=1 Tax=Sphingomonas sp. CLY1604 TaxID=3457786 RepID=UPI003FD6C669